MSRHAWSRWVDSLLDAGIDPAVVESAVRRRARASAAACLAVAAVTGAFAAYHAVTGPAAMAWVLLVAAILAAASPALLPPARAGGLATAALLGSAVASLHLGAGGPWLQLAALVALFTLDLRWAGLWILGAGSAAVVLLPRAGAGPAEVAGEVLALAGVSVVGAAFVALARQAESWLRSEAETRKRAEQEARAANRVKSEFLAKVSHELRTPMNGVIGMTDLLLRSSLPDLQRQRVEVIESSAETLMALVDDLLDLSKIEVGKLALNAADFRLRELVGRVVELLRLKADSQGLALELEIEEGLPDALRGDIARLRQVLLNLVGNAIKFTRKGEVVVRVEGVPAVGAALRLRFTVRDTGIGVSEELRPHLFTPFVQGDGSARRRFGGTGLGLAISKRLVELMEGEIGFESPPGGGSIFFFEVPLEPARSIGRWGRRLPPARAAADRFNVLVVDDNPVNRLVAVSQVEAFGYVVEAVDGGEGALEALERTPYDAVLMDCQMPGLDGYDTTRRIRGRGPEADQPVVIAVTAHAMKGERERCLAAGMDDYVAKPYRGEDLAEVLARWLLEGGVEPRPGRPKAESSHDFDR